VMTRVVPRGHDAARVLGSCHRGQCESACAARLCAHGARRPGRR
jgi:hypothetical protein